MPNLGEIIGTGFERLVRWAYPGLLFMTLLGLGRPDVFEKWQHTRDAVFLAVGVFIVAGFVIYTLQRYVLHDVIEMPILHGIGWNAFARTPRRIPLIEGLVDAWAEFLKTRFGESNDRKRDVKLFSDYLMSRWAVAHALGLTSWVLPIMYFAATFDSPLRQLGLEWLIWALAAAFLIGHLWQIVLLERAEREFFRDSAPSTPT